MSGQVGSVRFSGGSDPLLSPGNGPDPPENLTDPISDLSGVLMLNSSGSLVLLSQNTFVTRSANSTTEAGSPVVELLDSGNLV